MCVQAVSSGENGGMKAVTNEKIIFHYVVVSFYILLANIMKHYENALDFWNEQNKYSLSNLKPAFICAHMYEQRIYVHIYATTMFECMTYQHDLTHRDMNLSRICPPAPGTNSKDNVC